MTTFDFSPLFGSTIGFDRVSRLLETASRADASANSYPPYNIERTGEDAYRIAMAVAGFGEDDLNVTVEDNTLTVQGKVEDKDGDSRYLHRGIAGRSFERRFQLADFIEVRAARLENGLLEIELAREVPEHMKPRTIAIKRGLGDKLLGRKKAA
jgi:molecular chaperone IbpA